MEPTKATKVIATAGVRASCGDHRLHRMRIGPLLFRAGARAWLAAGSIRFLPAPRCQQHVLPVIYGWLPAIVNPKSDTRNDNADREPNARRTPEETMKTNEHGMPLMGLGTFGRTGNGGIEAILAALEIGYRHIDTAQTYDTEAECGEALRRSGLARDAVFITTKISTGNFGPGQLVPSLRRSLDALKLDSVDLTLLHWPSPHGKIPLAVYVEQVAEAQALGLTKKIGVSNFTVALLDEARALLGQVPIVNNQVECHPYLQNNRLVDHCRRMGVAVTCYLPIARGRLAGDPVLEKLARDKNCTVEQLALAFSMARGLCVIPASGHRGRMQSNFDAQQVVLDDADMALIAGLDRGERYIDFDWAPDWD